MCPEESGPGIGMCKESIEQDETVNSDRWHILSLHLVSLDIPFPADVLSNSCTKHKLAWASLGIWRLHLDLFLYLVQLCMLWLILQ